MGAVLAKIVFKKGSDRFDLGKYASLNDIPVSTLRGEQTTLGELGQGKKLFLIVNVASK